MRVVGARARHPAQGRGPGRVPAERPADDGELRRVVAEGLLHLRSVYLDKLRLEVEGGSFFLPSYLPNLSTTLQNHDTLIDLI